MKRATFVACSPRPELAKSGLFLLKSSSKTTLTQALWPPAGTKQQHSQKHKTNGHEQQEPAAPPLASSASLIADHSAASMRALSASLSTHDLGLLLDLLSTTMFTGDSSLMMWFKEREVSVGSSV